MPAAPMKFRNPAAGALARGRLLVVAWLLAGCASAPTVEPGPPSSALPIADTAFLDREVQRELAGQPGVSGVRLVQQNPLAFAYRLETARRAERSLDLQYYIWHDDFTGRLLAAELIHAADRGVRVRLLLDDLDARAKHVLLAAATQHPNLEVRLFNPFFSDGSTAGLVGELLQRGRRLNHRMHNKAWIADNRIAIVGGRNIGDEYFGAAEHANFSDTGLIIGGPAVADVSREFDTYWNSSVVVPMYAMPGASRRPEDLEQLQQDARAYRQGAQDAPYAMALADPGTLAGYLAKRPPPIKVQRIEVLADDPAKMESAADGAAASRVLAGVSRVMARASREILIVSPYFVPGEAMVADLAAAVKRGVRVAVLTNSLAATDVAGVHAGYSRYREALLRGGVELYEMKRNAGDEQARRRISFSGSSQASLHTKAVVVDQRWSFIGSMNLDPRSVNINTEMGVLVESEVLAAQVLAQFGQNTAPEVAHRVLLDGRHGLAWHDRVEGRERVLHAEPEAGLGRRFMAALLRWLPLESQL